MKGIILAGGSGTRLFPLTSVISKQLLPVYNKPMIYYSISTLMLAGIRDILVICDPEELERFRRLLGDGSRLGLNVTYETQDKPRGIAEALIIGEHFVGSSRFCLVLGDNIFWGQGLTPLLEKASSKPEGATIFGYRVGDPSRFGIVELDVEGNPKSIKEKPVHPKGNIAITGLYFFDEKALKYAKEISPSERGELEITSVLEKYLEKGSINVEVLGRGYAWLDAGTHDSLLEASLFVETIEKRQGFKIACIEEISLSKGWLEPEGILANENLYRKSKYGEYVLSLVK